MAVGILDRSSQISADIYWRLRRYDYFDGIILYEGVNEKEDAKDTDSTWGIWKYYYSNGGLVEKEGPVTGAWNNRYSLSWTGPDEQVLDSPVSGQDNTSEMLADILDELKIITMQLSLMTGVELQREDV